MFALPTDALASVPPDALASGLTTIGVLLLVFHIHAERESFHSWFLRALRYAIPGQTPRAVYQEDTTQIRKMVDEARVQNVKSAIRFGVVFVGFSVTYHLQHQENHRYSGVLAYCMLVYAMGLFVAYSHVHWTPLRMTAITTLVNFTMLVRTCAIQDQGVWFLHVETRAIFRLVLAIVDMDHRRVALWNLLFFFANTNKTVKMTADLPALQRPRSWMLITEGSVCVLVWIASYMAQMWVTECVRTACETSASRIDKTMTDHLLSAFCDAQVKLGSHLQLVGPHEKLSSILLGSSAAGNELLQGTSFLDYLASADKARFRAFIDASSAPSEQCTSTESKDFYERPKTLPSALHVHLQDSSGRYVPASIFHSAAMITDGESHHLIGICVDSSQEFTETQQNPRDSAEQRNDDDQAQMPRERTSSSSIKVSDDHSQRPSKKRSSSVSSNASSSSSRSRTSLRLKELPLIERLSFTFDPFEWSIHKVSLNLSDASDKPPALDDCILQPDGQEFRKWVQAQVSTVLFEEGDKSDEECRSAMYGSVMMALPNMVCSKQTVICAKYTWLDLEDLADVADDDEKASVTLHLEGVQQISDSGKLKAVNMSTISEDLHP